MKTSECKRCGKQIPDSHPVHTCTPKEIMNQQSESIIRMQKDEITGLKQQLTVMHLTVLELAMQISKALSVVNAAKDVVKYGVNYGAYGMILINDIQAYDQAYPEVKKENE